jgi:hypothetical protein
MAILKLKNLINQKTFNFLALFYSTIGLIIIGLIADAYPYPTTPNFTDTNSSNSSLETRQTNDSSQDIRYSLIIDAGIPLTDLTQKLEDITVKIKVGDVEGTEGSGFLIHKTGQVYLVLTNLHVVSSYLSDPNINSIAIMTSDGNSYQARLNPHHNFLNYDLAILEFESVKSYVLAKFPYHYLPEPEVGDIVLGGGFPSQGSSLNSNIIHIALGRITLKLNKTLEQGYQLGYSNPIVKGMSGGPLINTKGEVVAVNGVHSQPLWGSTRFDDGSLPCPPLQHLIDQSSWGIPVQALNQFFISNLLPLSLYPWIQTTNNTLELQPLQPSDTQLDLSPETVSLRWQALLANQCLSLEEMMNKLETNPSVPNLSSPPHSFP